MACRSPARRHHPAQQARHYLTTHPTTPTPQVRATRVARVSGRTDDPMKQTRYDPMKQARNETAVITPTARVTAARLAIREARPRRLTSTLLWAAQIPLAALFIAFGLAKLTGGLGLLMPWLAGLAAAGLAADMAGATIINATVLHNTAYGGLVWVTLPLCAACALLAYGRRHQITALAAAIRR